jgi:hypothetical protein
MAKERDGPSTKGKPMTSYNRKERESVMARERKRFIDLQWMGLRSSNHKNFCNRKHLQ